MNGHVEPTSATPGRERSALGDGDGHGGAGVTLSWGCADEVLEIVGNA